MIWDMTTEQRLSALERSVAGWRVLSFALVLLVVAHFFICADFIPNDAKFDKITAKSITVDDGDAWIDIQAKGTSASIALKSAQHEQGTTTFTTWCRSTHRKSNRRFCGTA
jgi:hypothetical protein